MNYNINRTKYLFLTLLCFAVFWIINVGFQKEYDLTFVRIIEIIIFGVLFHLRANDSNIELKGYVVGYISLFLAFFVPIFLYVIWIGGMIYGTHKKV